MSLKFLNLKVESLDSIKDFYNFIVERSHIYYLKEVRGLPSPWTLDKTLQDFKFCNVQRHLDTGSRLLIKNVIENEALSPEDKLKNMIFYRMFNRREHFDLFPLIENGKIGWDDILKLASDYALSGTKMFNNAYAIRGTPPKWKTTIENLSKVEYGKLLTIIQSSFACDAIRQITKFVPYAGFFIAGQIYLDCTYHKDLANETGNDFLIIGPGALEGLEIMFGKDFGGLYPDSIVRHLWEMQPEFLYIQKYPENSKYANGRLSLMDIQHCLCEYRKYLKWKSGKGMKRKYN